MSISRPIFYQGAISRYEVSPVAIPIKIPNRRLSNRALADLLKGKTIKGAASAIKNGIGYKPSGLNSPAQ